ncbi:hypothetical protein ACFPRA_12895 [Sporosarcina soli]|uniref:Uncharacterized protein n=1 Tax=Sporosarcina soli TaxID=334736 RepID=A0ABW0TK63_9BACL
MAMAITNKKELNVGQKPGEYVILPYSANTQPEELAGKKSCKRSCKMCKCSNKATN